MVNFKQIQEVFVEALAIYLKNVEAFLRQYSADLLQWDSKQPIKEALRLVLMQSGADALAVTKPDKQIPQSSHACRFEGW